MKRSLQMVAACAVTMVLAAGEFVAPAESSEPTSAIVANQTGDGRIEVLAQGEGPVIVLLPSLGRSASDFDAIAVQLASAGYRVLRPQPRGIGRSVAPLTGITLHDYAADVAVVIEQERMGPAFVVGHAAFGSRVARLLAADRPELVTAVAMVAADAGGSPTVPKLREAINTSANLALPDDERIEALQFAFFAPGNDASAWLQGWYPAALRAEQRAGELTPRQNNFAAEVPVLYVQPSHDPIAHVEDSRAYRERFGSRVSVVVIEQSSRAVIVEQPDAVSAALVGFARKLWPHAMLRQ